MLIIFSYFNSASFSNQCFSFFRSSFFFFPSRRTCKHAFGLHTTTRTRSASSNHGPHWHQRRYYNLFVRAACLHRTGGTQHCLRAVRRRLRKIDNSLSQFRQCVRDCSFLVLFFNVHFGSVTILYFLIKFFFLNCFLSQAMFIFLRFTYHHLS